MIKILIQEKGKEEISIEKEKMLTLKTSTNHLKQAKT